MSREISQSAIRGDIDTTYRTFNKTIQPFITIVLVLLTGCSHSGGGGGSDGDTDTNHPPPPVSLRMLADINTQPTSPETRIRETIEYGGWLYFQANDGVHGTELWRTDGSTVEMVADINPEDRSFPQNFVIYNSWLYFTANDGENGEELWRTNGSTTELAADVFPGAPGSYPAQFVQFNEDLYFIAQNSAEGDQLFRTDGDSVTHVTDLDVMNEDYYSYYLTEVNGWLYFVARADDRGWEVWRTNGIDAVRVTDVNNDETVNGGDSYPSSFVAFDNQLYFNANDASGNKLWRTDGTTTYLVSDAAKTLPKQVFNGWLWFSGEDATTGVELWRTNGTTTERFADIVSGAGNSSPGGFLVLNNQLLFTASDGSIYKTDGTVAPTAIAGAPRYRNSLAIFNNELYYAGTTATGTQLWHTDGTNASKATPDHIAMYSGSSRPMISFAGELYFVGYDTLAPNSGEQWWRMTAGDAVQVSDINSQQNTEPSDVGEIVEANGYAYIVENDEATTNLWRSDGTTSEMITIPELTFAPYNLTVYNDQLYFVGFTDAHGSEIWRTDWTTTERVTDINAGGASNPQELTPLGDYLYFSANDGLNGSLWRFDGVTTEQVLDGDSSVLLSPHDLFVHNGYLYFSASSGVWRTNGGTPEEITKADTGTSISGAARFTVAVDKVFFRGSDPDTGNGRELWVAGGTTATRLTDINPGGGSLVFDNFVSMNQWLYFTIKDNMNGTLELWRSDGTTTNTAFRLALNPTDGHFTAYQNHIYFTHTTPETGQELWLTDGNTIELFEDLNPGPEWSYIDKLIELNGKLVFEADDGGRLGKEVWVSNGVTSEIIRNINNDGGVSADFLYVNGNRLYFLADDGVHGDEPWVLEINN